MYLVYVGWNYTDIIADKCATRYKNMRYDNVHTRVYYIYYVISLYTFYLVAYSLYL